MKLSNIMIVANVIAALSSGLFAQDAENVEQVGRTYNYWGETKDIAVDGIWLILPPKEQVFKLSMCQT